MKAIFILISCSITIFAFGQLKTPPLSPKCKMEQQVGLSKFTIEYSRPSVRGRVIFGDLIPYNQRWRLGANENSKISFDDDIFYRKSLYGNDLVNIRTEFKEREKAKQNISLDYDYRNMDLAQNNDINNTKVIYDLVKEDDKMVYKTYGET